MKSSRRGQRIALAGFILITLAVVGGLAWATASTLEVARLNTVKTHDGLIREAVRAIDTHLGSIVRNEQNRPYTDYVAYHTLPEARRRTGQLLAAQSIIAPSPILANGPPNDWIELYFQMNRNGVFSSPQIQSDTAALWFSESFDPHSASTEQARRTLEWLRRHLQPAELATRIEEALELEWDAVSTPGSPSIHRGGSGTDDISTAVRHTNESWNQFQLRRQRLRQAQTRHVPRELCLPENIVAENLTSATVTGDSAMDEVCLASDTPVRLSAMAHPQWLGSPENHDLKLVFARKVSAGNTVAYQGFVGDWNSLKPELLAEVRDQFPTVDLVPVLGNQVTAADDMSSYLISMDARLIVPWDPVAAAREEHRSLEGMLIAAWVVGITILVLAGWGVRNLVALTERRMQFAYAVTHELRTPLTTFRLYTDMLAAGITPEESKQEYYDTLNRESIRLSTLVEDVMEYARLENHKVRLNPVKTGGEALTARVRETLENRCQQSKLEARTQNDIPQSQEFETDVELVNQITSVLINNACRHTRGINDGTVLLHLTSENGSVHVNVIDNGPGIERADIRRIFRPFRRGRKADKAAHGGIGLGLALARSWARLLGGRLNLAARQHGVYGGAHFRLSLPASLKK